MRSYSGMNDERRLSYRQLYLASNQTKNEFEKENGLGRDCISKWLRTFAIEDKKASVTLTPTMSTLSFPDFTDTFFLSLPPTADSFAKGMLNQ